MTMWYECSWQWLMRAGVRFFVAALLRMTCGGVQNDSKRKLRMTKWHEYSWQWLMRASERFFAFGSE
jgi:hypothetical protein